MKLSFRAASIPCVAVLLAVGSAAHATNFSVSGQVWEESSFDTVTQGLAGESGSPTAVFTLTNIAPSDLLNFNSDNASGDYTLSNYLTSGGDLLNYISGSGLGGDSIDNDLFQFKGTTTLVNGSSYNFEHDDGLILYLTGNGLTNAAVINAGGPTSAAATAFTVCASGCDAAGGTYSFTLDYAEVDGAPAVLETTLPLTGPPPGVTPEPSSFVMLGSGLLAAAGAIRRRVAA